jgi:uncharacterized protein
MKYLVLLLIVLAGIWWLRLQRKPKTKPPAAKPTGPQAMLACVHCGTHVPESEATPGAKGPYCSPAHRDSHEV